MPKHTGKKPAPVKREGKMKGSKPLFGGKKANPFKKGGGRKSK